MKRSDNWKMVTHLNYKDVNLLHLEKSILYIFHQQLT